MKDHPRCRSRRRYRATVIAALFALLIFTPRVHAGHDDEYVPTISAERAKRLVESGEKIIFIDMRTVADFEKQRVPGARSIPVTEIQKRHAEIPQAGRVILYCVCPPGGTDETYAYFSLRDKGLRNVVVLEEGFSGWVKKKYPVESGPAKGAN